MADTPRTETEHKLMVLGEEFKLLASSLGTYSGGISKDWSRAEELEGEPIQNSDGSIGVTRVHFWETHFKSAKEIVTRLLKILDEMEALKPKLPESLIEKK